MKDIVRVLCAALIVLAAPAMATERAGAPSAAVQSAQQAKSSSNAPWIVLAVLVVGAVIAGLAASHSYPSTSGGAGQSSSN